MLTKKDMNKLAGLLYLLSISQNTSKRKASETLDISIDTVNKYLNELENEFGFKLLACNGRGTVITPQAQEILPLADTLKSILQEIDFVATTNSQVVGLVRVGIEDGITSTLFTEKVIDFFHRYPGLQIQAESGDNTSNLTVLETDLALSYTPPSGSDLVLCHSATIPCGLFASYGYIEEFGMPYDMDDLVNNHRFCEHIDNIRQINGWRELRKDIKHISYSSNSTYTVNYMTEVGAGIGIFPLNWRTENLINITNIVEDNNIALSYRIFLVAHKNTMHLPRIKAVIELIKEIMDEN